MKSKLSNKPKLLLTLIAISLIKIVTGSNRLGSIDQDSESNESHLSIRVDN